MIKLSIYQKAMKLLLDQGLPSSAAALLRNMGIDTIHVGEIEMSAAADIEIIQRAEEENRIVVTLDADFHTLLALAEATSPSVIRIRIERLRAAALVELLLQVTDECAEELLRGAAVKVEPGRIRTRCLPLLPTI
jgi:predicted nuclease of predicted toxin-antitoxin system